VTSERTQAIILRMSIISDIAQRVVRLPLHPGTQPGLQRAMSGAQWARWEARRVPNGQDTRLRVCHGNQHGDELGGYRHPLGSGGAHWRPGFDSGLAHTSQCQRGLAWGRSLLSFSDGRSDRTARQPYRRTGLERLVGLRA
jgi:hypothetical protein